MYGYIQICKPELKFREFDEYRIHYCGLCRALKKHFGMKAQFLLSYDLTFLALLLDSLYEPESEICRTRCIAHPIKKQIFIKSEVSEYAADMCLLLSAYKLDDDWRDEKSFFKKMLGVILSGKSDETKKKYSEKTAVIERELEAIGNLERDNCTEPELPASHFGNILAEILCYKNDVWSEKLRETGFHLGKFIYLSDAFDDIRRDRKKKCYNPFINENEKDPEFIDRTEELLRLMIAPAAAAFEYLPAVKNSEIIRNILYAGVWNSFKRKKQEYLDDKKEKKHERSI